MKLTELEQLLPGIIQRTVQPGNPLYALLSVMEDMQAPPEAILADLDSYFDPRRAPASFVSYLAGWVDLDEILPEAPDDPASGALAEFAAGTGWLRELVAAAAFLSQWRGTARGLLRFLETATGLKGFTIDEHAPGKSFHLLIKGPPGSAQYTELITRIVQMEKPAYVTYELQLS